MKITIELIDIVQTDRTALRETYQLKDEGETLTPNMKRPQIEYDENTGTLRVWRALV